MTHLKQTTSVHFLLWQVSAEDPGYNLRPEHIESTYMLHALTGDPTYRSLAARFQQTLAATNKAKCGYAPISNVVTGAYTVTVGSLQWHSYLCSERGD